MHSKISNYLYTHPEYYELIYSDVEESIPNMFLKMSAAYLKSTPRSVLDVGCGTARDLSALSKYIDDCWGFDKLENVISYAKKIRPHLRLSVGDMGAVRFDRTFDLIVCMGGVLMYALTNREIDKAFETFRIHSHKDTLLVIGISNVACYLVGKNFEGITKEEIEIPIGKAQAFPAYSFDLKKQILIRNRKWIVNEVEIAQDYCEYRFFCVQEIAYLLNKFGFEVLGIYDNKDMFDTDLTGQRLYIAAVYQSTATLGMQESLDHHAF